jgi:alpha-tubulin suppressor-like RCC1 family protein
MRNLVLVALLLGGCPSNNGNNNNNSCPSPFTLCGSTCTATQIDPANCGMCGTTCAPGQRCVAGSCTLSCPDGTTQCGTACAATASDNQNCGACGTRCTAGEMCSNGSCDTTCAAGYTTCGDHCADTLNDSQNCGMCNMACPEGQRCLSGSCSASCVMGRMPCNGGCVDTMTDPANCGGCNSPCLAGEICQGGSCVCGISALSGGHYTTCGVRSDQRVVCTSQFNAAKCWGGQNSDGTTAGGCGGSNDVGFLTPWAIPGLTSAASFASGGDFGCALKTDGTVWCLGSNNEGKLGNGEAVPSPKAMPVQVMISPSPTPAPLSGVKQIAAGGNHACALTNGGDVYCWGRNDEGQLGNPNGNSEWAVKMTLPGGLSGVKKVVCGWDHTLAIAGDDRVWCWGSNGNDECGTAPGGASPAPIVELSNVTDVSSTLRTSCALRSDQTAHCWGHNPHGQTSVDPTQSTQFPSPTPVPVSNVTHIAAGHGHTCARTSAGAVFCWGRNMKGQLGNGTQDFVTKSSIGGSSEPQAPSPSPQRVLLPDGTPLVAKSVTASHQTSCAVVGASDHPYCWGMNKKGQAGGSEINSTYARPILSCGY